MTLYLFLSGKVTLQALLKRRKWNSYLILQSGSANDSSWREAKFIFFQLQWVCNAAMQTRRINPIKAWRYWAGNVFCRIPVKWDISEGVFNTDTANPFSYRAGLESWCLCLLDKKDSHMMFGFWYFSGHWIFGIISSWNWRLKSSSLFLKSKVNWKWIFFFLSSSCVPAVMKTAFVDSVEWKKWKWKKNPLNSVDFEAGIHQCCNTEYQRINFTSFKQKGIMWGRYCWDKTCCLNANLLVEM